MASRGIPETVDVRRALASIGLVLGAGAMVAVAAGGARLLTLPLELGDVGTIVVRLAGVLAVVGAIVVLLRQGGRIRAEESGPEPTVVALRTAATIMGVITVLAFLDPPPVPPIPGVETTPSFAPRDTPEDDGPGGEGRTVRPPQGRGGFTPMRGSGSRGSGEGAAPPTPTAAETAAPPGLLQRIGPWLPPLLFLAFLFLCWHLLTRTSPEAAEEEGGLWNLLAPAEARAGLETALDEVADGSMVAGRPGEQITAAYLRLLGALADAGAGRRPHEGPHEHLGRVLSPLGVRPEPLRRLAELYVLAQFSERPVTDAHRAAAVAALESSLADLRTAAAGGAPRRGAA